MSYYEGEMKSNKRNHNTSETTWAKFHTAAAEVSRRSGQCHVMLIASDKTNKTNRKNKTKKQENSRKLKKKSKEKTWTSWKKDLKWRSFNESKHKSHSARTLQRRLEMAQCGQREDTSAFFDTLIFRLHSLSLFHSFIITQRTALVTSGRLRTLIQKRCRPIFVNEAFSTRAPGKR